MDANEVFLGLIFAVLFKELIPVFLLVALFSLFRIIMTKIRSEDSNE
jgi:hypothetical protein